MNIALQSEGHVLAQVNGCVGLITLNRPQALNALSLAMVRDVTALLQAWRDDAAIQAVVIHGTPREGRPVFCAGGDIRFFHQAALAGDAKLGEFFTEEYQLDHLIHDFPKPCIALMDGVVMGGGMGLAQGCKLRVVTESSRLAMPETGIGLFPDVGGGWFLAQCPGHVGEWLALTGEVMQAGDAIEMGLADVFVPAAEWPAMLEALRTTAQPSAEHVVATVMEHSAVAPDALHMPAFDAIDAHFGAASVSAILTSLDAEGSPWAQAQAAQLRKRSPLMMAVTLEQIRRARALSLAEDLRMERDMVHHCFHLRAGAASETVEGIRALAVDKDHAPRWNPARLEDVTPQMVAAFFESPWSVAAHPLATL